ncbi:MAG: serine--tRNA ligase [Patescibacteria group bacterium]|nr:serine--tRNA ligase [Patescibacteria group bacterium]
MLDIQFIRDNTQLVKERSAQKGYTVQIDQLLEIDGQRRTRLTQIDELRARRNAQAAELKQGKPSDEQIAAGRQLKEELATLEADLVNIDNEYLLLLKAVPNIPLDDVPVGASEQENVVAKRVGEPTVFDFAVKTHWELAEAKDLIDKDRATKVAGPRFAYIKGGLVELQFAIMQFVTQTLGDETVLQKLIAENGLNIPAKPFVPVLPPAMIKTSVYEAMDRLEPRDDRYKVGEADDDLWLQGSAEHTLGSMYQDEILAESQLPIRYVGYLTSFRREAGTYGKDTEGIIRMHQFDKLEMEVFSTPETGLDEHKLLCALQEYLVQQLELPYQILQKCTADIGKPNARGIDLETWMPGQDKYRETHTADYMTDYQSRRLKTRFRREPKSAQAIVDVGAANPSIGLVHTNDATAFALGRIMVAIMENYQTADGNIKIPTVLQPYMANKTQI